MNEISQTRLLQLALFRALGESLLQLQGLTEKNIKPKDFLNYRCLLSEIRGYWAGLQADYNKQGHQVFPLRYLSTNHNDQNVLSASAVGIVSFLMARERCLDEPNCIRDSVVRVVSEGMGVNAFSADTWVNILLRFTTGCLGLINTTPAHVYVLDKFKSRFLADVGEDAYIMTPVDYMMSRGINDLPMRMFAQGYQCQDCQANQCPNTLPHVFFRKTI